MSLQDEIRQTRPFASKAQEATIALMRTAHIIRRRFEAVAEPHGITSQQYNVLRILRGARGPLPTMEIAERMIEPTPGITRLVNSLEQRELIRREQWPGDRRQMLCQITPAGLRLLAELDDVMNAFDEQLAGTLSEDDLTLLISLLERIRKQVPL